MLRRRKYIHRSQLANEEFRQLEYARALKQAVSLCCTVLMLVLVSALALVCAKPWRELIALQHERDKLQETLEQRQQELERVKNEALWIAQDPEYIEMVARDKSNLALPGEQILRIEQRPAIPVPRKG